MCRGLSLVYVSFRQIRAPVPPFPPVGPVAAPCGSPAVPHLHRYYGVVRLLIHPCAIASGFPWRSRFRSCERRWRALLGSWGIPLEACPELGTPATSARPCNSGRPDAAFRLVNGVGIATSRISELNLHGLLPCCVRFAPTSRPVNGNTRYRPACSLWPYGTCTRWTPSRGFTASSSVPPLPRLSQRDNKVGRRQEFSSSFFSLLIFFLLDQAHPSVCVRPSLRWTDLLPSSISALCPPYALSPVTSSLGCCPPNISSILTDHDELSELPGFPGRAGRLINRSVTVRTSTSEGEANRASKKREKVKGKGYYHGDPP